MFSDREEELQSIQRPKKSKNVTTFPFDQLPSEIKEEILKHLPSEMSVLLSLRTVDKKNQKMVDAFIQSKLTPMKRKLQKDLDAIQKQKELSDKDYTEKFMVTMMAFMKKAMEKGYLPLFWKDEDIHKDMRFVIKRTSNFLNPNPSEREFFNEIKRHCELADLSNMKLPFKDFSGAHLQGANFQSTYLSKSNFGNANLRNVNFSNANLNHATLLGANLINANLSNADLRGANVSLKELQDSKSIIGARLKFYSKFKPKDVKALEPKDVKAVKAILTKQYMQLLKNNAKNIPALIELFHEVRFDGVLRLERSIIESNKPTLGAPGGTESCKTLMQDIAKKLIKRVQSMKFCMDDKIAKALLNIHAIVNPNENALFKPSINLKAAVANNQSLPKVKRPPLELPKTP